jgi:myosin-crossreactive antigen
VAARPHRELAARRLRPPHHRRDLRETEPEHLLQHEDRPLERAEPLEQAEGGTRRATALHLLTGRGPETISLGQDDLALFTLGSITADATYGGMDDVPALVRDRADHGWSLWERIAARQPDFGRPMTFCGNIDEHKWESSTLTTHDRVLLDRIVSYTGNQPWFRSAATPVSRQSR